MLVHIGKGKMRDKLCSTKCLSVLLSLLIGKVFGVTDLRTTCDGLKGTSFSMSCVVDPQTSTVLIKVPSGANAASCLAPLPTTSCSPVSGYSTTPTKVSTVTTFDLQVNSLSYSTHDGNWTCNHGNIESDEAEVVVNSPLNTENITTNPSDGGEVSSVQISCRMICQYPTSNTASCQSVSIEILYAKDGETNYTTMSSQPTFNTMVTDGSSSGCDSHEKDVEFVSTITISDFSPCDTVAFKCKFTQQNLGTTRESAASASFQCPAGCSWTDVQCMGFSILGFFIAALVWILILLPLWFLVGDFRNFFGAEKARLIVILCPVIASVVAFLVALLVGLLALCKGSTCLGAASIGVGFAIAVVILGIGFLVCWLLIKCLCSKELQPVVENPHEEANACNMDKKPTPRRNSVEPEKKHETKPTGKATIIKSQNQNSPAVSSDDLKTTERALNKVPLNRRLPNPNEDDASPNSSIKNLKTPNRRLDPIDLTAEKASKKKKKKKKKQEDDTAEDNETVQN